MILMQYFSTYNLAVADVIHKPPETTKESTDSVHPPNKCSVCGIEFTKRSNRIRHMRKQHPEEKIPDEKVVRFLSSCLECSHTCKNVSELKTHLSTAHDFQFKVEDKEFENEEGMVTKKNCTLFGPLFGR